MTKERGVYNLYVQVAGGDGSIEQAVDGSPNEMEVDESGHRASGGPSAGEPVRPREMGVPSDGGGEEAVAPRVPPVPAKPTQADRSWCEQCVRGRGRVSAHVSVLEGELLDVGVDYACMGPERSQVTILVCKCKRTGCLAATQVPEKGMNAYALAFWWMAARFGMETIVVEVR